MSRVESRAEQAVARAVGAPFMASTSQAVYRTQLVDICNKDLP